jgi:CubicO group peptidase (beta-lactamase class C family)
MQPMDADMLDRAFGVVRDQVARGDLPVAAIGVANRAGVVRAEVFTSRDGPAASVDSRFLVASITKPIVATAVIQLVEAGRLSLAAPVADYLPEFEPQPAGPNLPARDLVTTWHLLTHTSGMADPVLVRDWPFHDRAQLLQLALQPQLRFVPGTQYAYCSNSFCLLGELLHRLGGLDYPEYLRARIFEPLGMVDTSFDPFADGAEAGVVRPEFAGAPPAEQERILRGFTATAAPGGGLWSTVGDLLAFGRAILNGGSLDGARIVGPRSIELMTRDHTGGIREAGMPPRDPHYGLGWSARGGSGRALTSPSAFGHGGATGSQLTIDPELDLVYVFLGNQWGGPWRPAEEVLGAVAVAAAAAG